VAFLIIWRA